MTEIEQKIIKKISDLSGDYKCYDNRINHEESLVLDRLLTEIQQYRAIGTVRGYERVIETSEENYNLYKEYKALLREYEAIGTVEELKTAMKYVSLAKKHGTVGKTIDSCAEYESIGTIEEFKALKEKSADIEKIIESIKQLPTQDFMGVLHIPRTATINRIKRGGNCELPEV